MKSAFDDHICPGLAKMEKKFAERKADFLIGEVSQIFVCFLTYITQF